MPDDGRRLEHRFGHLQHAVDGIRICLNHVSTDVLKYLGRF
jgi:hypothetical protein